ncbi:flocculation protein FLO11-like [Varroa jacobsoni]|uniref:flocculation protein FLO11-like n=1 Tax=Varroa jacobsoni TaxID=62625 RepID=UPI000BF45468|nr:flocculation protein FLO11-like [Varroa jacobsoni]
MAPALLAGSIGFLVMHSMSLLISVYGQPYSYIYFKGPGAKEPTFTFNLTHPSEQLSPNRPPSELFGVVIPPAPAARNQSVSKTTVNSTFSPVSTLGASGIEIPAVFLESAGKKLPASPQLSQTNQANYTTRSTDSPPSKEVSRSKDFATPATPPVNSTKKPPLIRSVPQRSEVQNIFEGINEKSKPFKFPKGKSGIMVRLPGGASYFVDFGTTYLDESSTTALLGTNKTTTTPLPGTTTIKPSSPVVRTPLTDFTSQLLSGFTRQPTEITSKKSPRFTRPDRTRKPSRRRFQDSSLFSSNNGSVSSVPSTKKQFDRNQVNDKDTSRRFTQIPVIRRPSTGATVQNRDDRSFKSEGRLKSKARNSNRGQLGGANVQVRRKEDGGDKGRPELRFEGARDDVEHFTTPLVSRKTVPTRKPEVIKVLRDKLRQQQLDEFEEFPRQDDDDYISDDKNDDRINFKPTLSLFDPALRFNGIDARPVTKTPERTRKLTQPSSRFPTPSLPPSTSTVADIFGDGRTFAPTTARPVTTTRRPTTISSTTPATTWKPDTTTNYFSTGRNTQPPTTNTGTTFLGTVFPDVSAVSRTPAFPTFSSFPTSNWIASGQTKTSPTTSRPSLPTRAPTLITRSPTPSIFKISVITTTQRPTNPTTIRTFRPTTFTFLTFPQTLTTTSRPQTTFQVPITTTAKPSSTRFPMKTIPSTLMPSIAFTTVSRPLTTSRLTTTERPLTTTLLPTQAVTATSSPARQGPLKTSTDFAVTSRADFCPEKRYNSKHTLCRSTTCHTVERGLKNGEEQEILYAHNRYRAQVATGSTHYSQLQQASDMLLLEWDDDLAATAQAHADLCSFDHDCSSCRRIAKFSSVGQNLCLDQTNAPNPQANWTACIKQWFDEALLVRPSDIHPYHFIHDTGHFTQMAWSRTWKIGCGYAMYPSKQPPYEYDLLYTCNYGPSGNTLGEDMYKLGAPCSQCPRGTKCMKNEFYGLCEATSPSGPIEDDVSVEAGTSLLLDCNFHTFSRGSSDCDITTNGPFVMNAPFAIGSHTEVVLRSGQQARLTFQKQFPSENPICVIVDYDVGPGEHGKSSFGKMLLQVRGKNYEAEANFGDPSDEGVRKFFYDVDTLGIVKKLELSFVFSVPAGSEETFFDLYRVQVIEGTCYGFYQRNQLRAKARA